VEQRERQKYTTTVGEMQRKIKESNSQWAREARRILSTIDKEEFSSSAVESNKDN